MSSYLHRFADAARTPPRTPQTAVIPGREADQATNNAGGVAFVQDDWARLRAWLILGSEGGTYYVAQQELTAENTTVLGRCLAENGVRVVELARDVSLAGLAPRNDQAIYALARAIGHPSDLVRAAARTAVPAICRTGTHLFMLVAFLDAMGGWGPAKRRAIARWYEAQSAEQLAYQMAKYQRRGTWSHHDVLHVAHPRLGSVDPVTRNTGRPVPGDARHLDLHPKARLANWAKSGRMRQPASGSGTDPLAIVAAMQEAQAQEDTAYGLGRVVALIHGHGLTREMVPSWALGRAATWQALLPTMPITALVRNLPTMTRAGLFDAFAGGHADLVWDRLHDVGRIRRGRVHPIQALVAARTYAAGRSERGSATWTPVDRIERALDDLVDLSFQAVEPTGKTFLVAIDVSGSMKSPIPGVPSISCAEACAVLSLVALRREPHAIARGFSDDNRSITWSGGRTSVTNRSPMIDLGIRSGDTIGEAARKANKNTGGGTDCALPMIEAERQGWDVDCFVVLTDNETWYGTVHPCQALESYRQARGRDARLVVVGMASNGFSIADPGDPRSLDVVGFDPGTPHLISSFATGFAADVAAEAAEDEPAE